MIPPKYLVAGIFTTYFIGSLAKYCLMGWSSLLYSNTPNKFHSLNHPYKTIHLPVQKVQKIYSSIKSISLRIFFRFYISSVLYNKTIFHYIFNIFMFWKKNIVWWKQLITLYKTKLNHLWREGFQSWSEKFYLSSVRCWFLSILTISSVSPSYWL